MNWDKRFPDITHPQLVRWFNTLSALLKVHRAYRVDPMRDNRESLFVWVVDKLGDEGMVALREDRHLIAHNMRKGMQ